MFGLSSSNPFFNQRMMIMAWLDRFRSVSKDEVPQQKHSVLESSARWNQSWKRKTFWTVLGGYSNDRRTSSSNRRGLHKWKSFRSRRFDLYWSDNYTNDEIAVSQISDDDRATLSKRKHPCFSNCATNSRYFTRSRSSNNLEVTCFQ